MFNFYQQIMMIASMVWTTVTRQPYVLIPLAHTNVFAPQVTRATVHIVKVRLHIYYRKRRQIVTILNVKRCLICVYFFFIITHLLVILISNVTTVFLYLLFEIFMYREPVLDFCYTLLKLSL